MRETSRDNEVMVSPSSAGSSAGCPVEGCADDLQAPGLNTLVAVAGFIFIGEQPPISDAALHPNLRRANLRLWRM